MMYTWNDGTYLAHHGIKGQRWGVRRFQNPDGSLTEAGRRRYGDTFEKAANRAREFKQIAEQEQRKFESQLNNKNSKSAEKSADEEWNKILKKQPKIANEVGGDWRNCDDDDLWDILGDYYNVDVSKFKEAIHDTNDAKKRETADDLNRWINVTKQQQMYYENLANRYSNIPYGKLDKKLVKEAKKFVDHAFYTDADYSDFYYGGKWDNYQLDLGTRDRYR